MSGSKPLKWGVIAKGVIGALFLLKGIRHASFTIEYGHVPMAAWITIVIGIACLVWAYREWRREPAAAVRGARPVSGSRPAQPAISDRSIDHPYLRLDLPSGWRATDAPGALFAAFERKISELEVQSLNVVMGQAPPGADARELVARMMAAHAESLAENHPGRMDPQLAEEKTTEAGVFEITRIYLCRAGGPEWRVTARYAATLKPVGARGMPLAHAFLQITVYESAWASEEMGRVVREAAIMPLLDAITRAPALGTSPRYPYVLHANSAKQRDEALAHVGKPAEGVAGLVPLGGDLFLTVAEDHPEAVRPLFPSDVREAGGTLDAWLREAGERIGRELGTAELPVQVLSSPVMPGVKILTVGPTWKAASAVGSRALHERAVRELGTDRLCVLLPHRDRIFVFAQAEPAMMTELAQGIVRAEQPNARKPLSNEVFRLGPGGISPLGGPPPSTDGVMRSDPDASVAGTFVTLRKRELALRIPQEMPDRGTRAEESASCPDCKTKMEPVVITTGGPYGDAKLWEIYPVAVDGFRCTACGTMTYPRVLSAERITEIINEGVAGAQTGRLDDAELALRRAIASWPNYSPPRANLGAVYLDRVRGEQQGQGRPEVIERYLVEAERQLRRANSGEPPSDFQVWLMLGRLLLKRGRPDEGRPLLERVVAAPQAPEGARAAARSLLAG